MMIIAVIKTCFFQNSTIQCSLKNRLRSMLRFVQHVAFSNDRKVQNYLLNRGDNSLRN